jgi:predicted DNA-binding protein (UPF0251 family)
MTATRKEIYASAEESKAVLRDIPVTTAHLEVLRLIDEAGLNEQGVSTQHYVQGVINICASLVEAVAREREACALICDRRYNFEASRISQIIRARGQP